MNSRGRISTDGGAGMLRNAGRTSGVCHAKIATTGAHTTSTTSSQRERRQASEIIISYESRSGLIGYVTTATGLTRTNRDFQSNNWAVDVQSR